MKTVESRNAASTIRRANAPFFSKERDQHFFGSTQSEKPFIPSYTRPASSIQAKLNIGQPNDQYEQEADSVADQVVQHSGDSFSIRKGSFSPTSVMPFFQQKSASQEEEKVQKLEEEEDISAKLKKLQRKPIFESNAEPPEDEMPVQKKADQSDSQTANPAIETSLSSSKGSGHPLPEKTRQKMESSMGTDFSDVRIHDDSDAARMSKDMNAQAFTHGKDIYFNSGKYDTTTKEGNHLLAHELTHTIQQGNELHKSRIQLAGPNPQAGSGSTGSPPPGPPYKINNDELDPSANPKTLKIERISLPNFKKRNSDKFKWPLVTLTGRPPATKQDPTWRNTLNDVGKSNAKVAAFLSKIQKPQGSDTYFLKAKESEFRIFGTLKQLQEDALVPRWTRFGKGGIHEVDHVVEMQLGGADQMDNYELLDATANNSAGPSIQGEKGRRVKATLEAFTNAGVPGVPDPKVILSETTDYVISFSRIDNWNLNCSGDGKIYWTKTEIEEGKQFLQLRGMTAEEIAKSQGTQNELVLYVNERSGSPLRIALPFAGTINNWLPGIDLVSLIHNTTAADDANFGTIGVQLRQDFSKNLKSNAAFNISFNKTPGLLNTGYMKFTRDQQALSGLLRFVGLSPLIIEEFRLDEKKGIVINGKIKTDLPLFKGAEIDLSVNGKDIRLSKTFSLGEVKSFPSPFKVTDISLSIFASTESGFGVDGNIDFEVKNLGKGSIKGTGATKDGFGLSGDFNVDKKTFDGNVHVGYVKKANDENGKWSAEGNIGIKEGVIKGIKKASLKASYKEAVFTVDGEGELSIPGIDKIKLHADFAENGDFTFVADVELKKLPGIKSGSAKVTVASKGEAGLKLGLAGEAVPDLPNVPGLSDLKLTISYLDGVFELRAKVGYKKGRFDGTIEVGVTNKQVDEKGQPQGEAQEKGDVSVFGYGSLKVDIYKDIKGTVSIRLTPEKDVLIGGKIEANNLKPFGEGFNYDKEIVGFPELEFPLAGIPGISVSAFIKGGVHFKFVWLPLILKELSVDFKETNIKELEKASLEIIGSVGSSAHAEVYLFIEAGLKARVLVATLSGSLGGEAGLGVDAEAGGKVDATWDMDKGLKFKEIEAFLDVTPKAIFRLTGQVSVDLDLWITSVNLYYHQWVLAEKQLDLSGITLKVKFPIRFKETGEVELPAYESMNIVKPDFSGDSGNKILDDAINGDAKKEEQKKKEELKIKIHDDLRSADNKDVTPTEYTKKMMHKYENAPDLQAFVKTTIEDESRKLEYEHFEEEKSMIRSAKVPLANKYTLLNMFTFFHSYVTTADVEAFKAELAKLEEDKKAEAANAAKAGVSQGPDNKPVNDIPGPPDTGNPPLNNNKGPVRKKEMADIKGKSDLQDRPPVQRNHGFESEKEELISGKMEKGTDINNVEDNFYENLNASKGQGQLLPVSVREQMETSLGADFSNVKIHNDNESHQLSKQINAQAFTYGNDIFFNAGKYDTTSKQGQYLLAHELTHVVQQNGNEIQDKGQMEGSGEPTLKIDNPQVQCFDIPFTDYETDFSYEGVKTAANLTVDAAKWTGGEIKSGAIWVKDRVEEGFEWIFDQIRDLINSGVEWLTNKFEEIKIFAARVFEDIKTALGSALDRITSPLDLIKDALGIMDAGMLSSAWNALSAGTNFLWQTIKTVVNGILAVGSGIWDTVSGFVDTLFDTVESLMNNKVFRLLPDFLQSSARGLFSTIQSLWISMRNFWTIFWNKLTSFVHDLMSSIEGFVKKIVSYAIDGLIAIVKTLKEVRDFIHLITSDPEAVIRPIVSQLAGKIEKEAPGKAKEVEQDKMQEALSKTKAPASAGGIIQRAPAGKIERSTASRSEVNEALEATFAEQWKALDIRKMLWETFVNMFWPPATIRAIGHEFYELFETDWANAAHSLFLPRNIFDDIGGFFHDLWSNFLILLDFPLALWRRLNSILMLLMGYVTIILIIVGAIGGAGVGAGAGLALAAELGYALFISFITAESASALKAFLDLYTARQTEQEKARDYLQIVGSIIGIGIALVIALIFFLLSNLVSAIASLIKKGGAPKLTGKETKIDSDKTKLPDDKSGDKPPEKDVKKEDPANALEAARAAVRLKINQIREHLGRINSQVDKIPDHVADNNPLRNRINNAHERLNNLEADLPQANSPEEINLINDELNDFNRDIIKPLQNDVNAANIPAATAQEQALINKYTNALRTLRQAQDIIDAGAKGEDLSAAQSRQAQANSEMDVIEAQAIQEHNQPGSNLSRLADQIDTLTERRLEIQKGTGDPAIGKSYAQSEAVRAAQRMPNQSPRGLSFQQIEDAIGRPPDNITGSETAGNVQQAGAIRLEWEFGDGSRIHVDVPGPENASPFEVNRGPHAGFNAPSPSEAFPGSNQQFPMDEGGTVVPQDSAPAHMPVTRDARLNFILKGRK